MAQRSVAFAVDAMGAELLSGDPEAQWRGMDFDTRRLKDGELFVALPGEQADGHDYLDRAVQAGAAALVVSRDLRREVPAPGVAWLLVDDTYRALHDLTRAVRRELPEHLVGITGSAGKTTTKELLGAMLARRFRVAKSPGNFNNLYGFPLSLMGIADDTQWMVAEMGMSTPGELRQVSLLGQPDVAVYTNVRPVHLENFDDLRGIADAKSELLAGLASGGLMVANADDPEVMYIAGQRLPEGARLVRYGFQQEAEVRGHDLEPLGGGRVGSRFRLTFDLEGHGLAAASGFGEGWIELPIHGLYNAENCLAAAAASLALGVSLDDIVAAMADFVPSRMRGEVHRLPNGMALIDDSYNSNPDAAGKALESARQLPATRYWAVLGDMLELGPGGPEFHREVGQRAAELGFRVLGVGPLCTHLVDAVLDRGGEANHVADASVAAQWATRALTDGELTEGDLMLVKGSRGIGLEAVTQAVTQASAETPRDFDPHSGEAT